MSTDSLSDREKELLKEFSFALFINKAYIDNDTQEMRWCATNSDTDPDLYNDEMTLELYADFLRRIDAKELPPERHRSDFWSGGMPYLSVSHYLDLNGDAVPGEVKELYVDGNKLKSKGIFFDTAIGKAAYKSVRENFIDEQRAKKNKVRISIAFVDWGHKHKSNGYEFNRKSLDDICPECLLELITGKSEGKIFKQGHLIHLALTRVPVNQRTIMEVERMTTQKEDAASIITEELAEEIAEKALETAKADLVIKAETEEVIDPVVEEAKTEKVKEEEDEVEDDEEEGKKKKDEKKAEHVLDPFLTDFKSMFDEIVAKAISSDDKLHELQNPFNALAEHLKSLIQTPEEAARSEENAKFDELKSLIVAQSESIQSLMQEVAILKQKSISDTHQTPKPETVRRSVSIDPTKLLTPAPVNKPLSIDEIARRSVFGPTYQ